MYARVGSSMESKRKPPFCELHRCQKSQDWNEPTKLIGSGLLLSLASNRTRFDCCAVNNRERVQLRRVLLWRYCWPARLGPAAAAVAAVSLSHYTTCRVRSFLSSSVVHSPSLLKRGIPLLEGKPSVFFIALPDIYRLFSPPFPPTRNTSLQQNGLETHQQGNARQWATMEASGKGGSLVVFSHVSRSILTPNWPFYRSFKIWAGIHPHSARPGRLEMIVGAMLEKKTWLKMIRLSGVRGWLIFWCFSSFFPSISLASHDYGTRKWDLSGGS